MTDAIRILHADPDLVVAYKPAGLLMHRSRSDRGASRFLLQEVRNLVGTHVFLANRLDKGTAGLVAMTTSPEGAADLGRQFAERVVSKTYLALVRGHAPADGRVDHPLDPPHDDAADAAPGTHREAVTAFRTIGKTEIPHAVGRYATARYSLLEIRPETGRRHQIRRHMKHLRHPVVGDRKYGDRDHNAFFRDTVGTDRMMLASVGLEFRHPVSGAPMSIEAAPDGGFLAVLRAVAIPVELTERGENGLSGFPHMR